MTATAEPANRKKIPGEIDPAKYTRETITWVRRWTPHLFSFRITRSAGFRFKPGQWARLGLYRDDDHPALAGNPQQALQCGPRYVWRAYSVVSATYDEYLEFYSIVVPEGDFTTHLTALEIGREILVEKASYGFLTLDRFQGGRDLWLLASGTGIAPYLSVLQEPEAWERFEHLIVVHSVRHADELAYREEVAALIDHPVVGEFMRMAPQRLIHVPLVTRDAAATAPASGGRAAPLHARITTALADGSLEQRAGLAMNHEDSRIMICGNPQMVDDIRNQLMIAGYGVSRSSKPGQIAVENYW